MPEFTEWLLNKCKRNNTIHFILCIISLTLILAGCSLIKQPHYTFNQKQSAPKLQEDIIVLKKILEANHPSLYWYTPKDSIDYYFNAAIQSVTDSLTEIQFRNKLAIAVSKIRCGHTSVRLSKAYNKLYNKNRYPQFPLNIKTWKDSFVVVSNLWPDDTIIKRGTIITGINGIRNSVLLDSIFQFISIDGYSDNLKSQLVSFNFPVWYQSVYGLDSTYTIQYIDTNGKEENAIIKNFKPEDTTRKTRLSQPNTNLVKKPSGKETRKAKLLNKRNMKLDDSLHTAFIHLATFNGGRLRTFFRKSFRAVEHHHIKNLVIDIRENGGGNVDQYVLLTKYLADSTFKVGDTVAAVSCNIKYKKYIQSSLFYSFLMRLSTRKMKDGRYHQHYLETCYYKPKKRLHFNGHIYLVQGGFTFSASAMFAAALKNQHNVTVAGEETGGAYYGNSAMYIPEITLPNSHLRVRLPLFRLVIKSARIKDGRGVMPDIWIPPSSEAIKNGVDIKMVKVKEMIMRDH